MVRLTHTERGRRGVLRRYQHARWGVVEVVTMWGENGSADVVRIYPTRDYIERIKRLCTNAKRAEGPRVRRKRAC